MKYILALLIFAGGLLSATVISAQKQSFGYVDTDYILGQIPEYRSAQKQLDDLAEQWKQEIKKKQEEVEKLYKEYQAEYVVMPEETRKKKEEEITTKEKEMNQYKNEKFGTEGELFKKRQTLMKPVQDRVFDAIQKLAKTNSYDFIFDKAGAVTILYSNPKYDRSDDVLDILGITPDKKLREPEKKPDDKQKPQNPNNPNNPQNPQNPQNPNNPNNPPVDQNPNQQNPNMPQNPPGGPPHQPVKPGGH